MINIERRKDKKEKRGRKVNKTKVRKDKKIID